MDKKINKQINKNITKIMIEYQDTVMHLLKKNDRILNAKVILHKRANLYQSCE